MNSFKSIDNFFLFVTFLDIIHILEYYLNIVLNEKPPNSTHEIYSTNYPQFSSSSSEQNRNYATDFK